MLLKGDAGFFRDACRVGIDGPKKILNLLLNFPLYRKLRAVWRRDLAWLDLLVHFRLHPYHSRSGGPYYPGKPMVDC